MSLHEDMQDFIDTLKESQFQTLKSILSQSLEVDEDLLRSKGYTLPLQYFYELVKENE